jgi:cholinesterase
VLQAGAVSVHLHMMSDMSRNLFQRAILFSGAAFDPFAIPTISNFAERLGQVMGFNGSTEAQLLEFLEKSEPGELVSAKLKVATQQEVYAALVDVIVGPVVEPSWSQTPFLTKDPVVAAKTAWSNNIDAIFTANSFEGLIQAFKEHTGNVDLLIEAFNNNPAYFAPLTNLKLNATSPQAQIYGQRIKDLYFDNSTGLTRDTLLHFYRVNPMECFQTSISLSYSILVHI